MGVACPVAFLGVSYADLPEWPLSVRVSREVGPAPMKLHTVEGWFKEEPPDGWQPISTTMGVAYSAPEAGRGSA